MGTRLIIDGNAVYEIDEDCLEYQRRKSRLRDQTKRQQQNENTRGKETDRKNE